MSGHFQKLLFALLYFAQGAVISYFSLFQKNYLIDQGVERSAIALLSFALLLPFVIKILFGFLSDRVNIGPWGNRRPYIVIGLLGAIGAFSAVSFVSVSSLFALYATLMFVASLSISFFDAATDGLAVDIIPDDDQGSVQSFMVAGKSIAVILFSFLIGHYSGSFKNIFLLYALIFLIPLLFILFARLPKTEAQTEVVMAEKSFWKDRTFYLLLLFASLYSFLSFGIDGLNPLFFKEGLLLDQALIGNYGSLRGLGAIIGALMIGYLLHRGSLKKISLSVMAFYFLLPNLLVYILDANNYLFLSPLWGVLWGGQEVIFLTLCMHSMKKYSSAFGFAFLMAFGNLGTAFGEGILTYLTKKMSYSVIYSSLSIYTVIPLLVLLFYFRAEASE